jgi:Tol biopolymer transport system component
LTSVHRAQGVGSAVHLPAGLTYVTSRTENSPKTVWAASLAGTEAERLGPGEDPLVSPDGSSVAAALSGVTTGGSGPALVVYSATGGIAHRYLNLASESAWPLAWSRDSRYLAVFTQPMVTIGGPEKPSALAILDVRERAMRTIVHGEIKGASFAPDRSDRLVFARAASHAPEAATNLYSVGPIGTGLRLLAGNQDASEAWVVRVDSGSARRLTSRGHPVTGRGISVDGSKVLIEEGSWQTLHLLLEGRPARQRLSTIPFSGGAATVLVTRASQASWNG